MCFSATASFAASAALVPAGIYCVKAALRKDRRFLPLAFVPIVFAVQQFTEGLVWFGLRHEDPALVEGAAVAYLFFAIAFWPFWIPLAIRCTEGRPGATRLLGLMTLVGLAWTWLYLPILLKPAELLSVEIVHHSIRYAPGQLPGYDAVTPWAWRFGYLVLVATPLIIGATRGRTESRGASYLGAATLLASFAVCYYLYWEVFVSLWCFFAAVLSLMLCYVHYRLPEAVEAPWRPWGRAPAAVELAPADGRVSHRQPRSAD